MWRRVGKSGWICLLIIILALGWGLPFAARVEAASPSADALLAELHQMDRWLGDNAAGNGWRKYLQTEALRAEIAKGDDADKEIVATSLSKFESKAAGLERPQFVAVRQALETWLAEISQIKLEELPEAVQAQKEKYQPLTDEQVAAGKKRLQAAVSKLGKFLPARSKAGAGWRKYLQFDELAAQLKPDATPDLKSLVGVFHLMAADVPGLERKEFADVTDALADYIDLVAVKNISDAQTQYEQQLDALSASLERYADDPTEEEHFNIGRRLGELTVGQQAGGLIQAIRRHHSRPNLYAEFSHPLIEVGMARVVRRNVDVRDNILGASIYGNGVMNGDVTVELIPSSDGAVLETVLKGHVNTNTTGSKSGVTFHSRGVTSFHARKRILFNEEGIISQRARCNAVTDNNVYNVSAGRIATNIAWGEINANRATSNRIAADHAEARIANSFENEATPMLAKSSQGFRDKFRNPLVRQREFPELFRFSTTGDRLHVVGMKANRFQIGAPNAAPELPEKHDMAVRVHQSFPDNMAAALLGGKTLTDEALKKQIIAMQGSLPDELKDDEDEEPWSITFARFKPVTVTFADNELEVTIRGQQYTSGEREFRSMNVSAKYTMELTPTGTKLVRQGVVKIEPPDFAIKPRQLSASEVTLKTILEKKFSKLFKEEVVSDGLELPGNWAKAGKLQAATLTSADGWLTVGWNLPSNDKLAEGQASLDKK